MAKRVLFIGGNFFPEPTGIGKFNCEMIDLLSRQGYHCTVITSYPYYPFWQVQKPYAKTPLWFKKEVRLVYPGKAIPIEIYRCPHYVPKSPTGTKRMFLDLSFCCSAFFKIIQLLFHERYNYVITVVPGFQIGLLAILYKKIKGAKFLYHIQDLQIDAARELRMIKSNVVIRILLGMERFILKNADVVSSISTGMIKRISEKCRKEIVLFPNWVDTKAFCPLAEKDLIKEEYGFNPSDKVILYSGAIGEKQGLERLLIIAERMNYIDSLRIVICGSGPYKENLKTKAMEIGLKNVIFLPLQPSEKLNKFLNMADVHLVLQKGNASDLVMPSKLTAILSVGGLVIVEASPGSCLHDVIIKNEMGIVIQPESGNALMEAIENTLKSCHEQIKMNARKYAEKYLTADNVLSEYCKYLQ